MKLPLEETIAERSLRPLQRLRWRTLRVAFAEEGEDGREPLEAFIRDVGSRCRPLPLLLALHTEYHDLVGVVGARRGQAAVPFGLEDGGGPPLEERIADAFAARVDREEVAEIGNLVARDEGLARTLVVTLAFRMLAEGRSFVTFAAAAAVREGLEGLGFDPHDLGPVPPASPAVRGRRQTSASRVFAVPLTRLCRVVDRDEFEAVLRPLCRVVVPVPT